MKQALLAKSQDRAAIIARGREVIRIECDALASLEDAIDDRFVEACRTILIARRQLVVTGIGKSGHIARKIAATFAATSTPAIYVHPSEAAHGDLGMLAEGDVLLVISNSGNTSELRPILSYARRHKIPIIGVASRVNSFLIERADVPLLLPQIREACAANIAPTTSTTLQLALGDALAMTVMDMRGVTHTHLYGLHPGGAIGLALKPVGEIMEVGDRMPLVRLQSGMPDVISIMTSGRFGLAGVVNDAGALVGIITDGDLRRKFAILHEACAQDVMTPCPKVLPVEMPTGDALLFLNDNQITAAFVVEDPSKFLSRPLGIVHIHDLLRHGFD